MLLRGYALVFCAACMWGLIGPVAKVALAAGMEPLEVAFWRTTTGWLLFAAHAVYQRSTRIDPRDLPLVLAFGVAGIFGLFGFYVLAVSHGGAALSAVLLYTAPAWVAFMSYMLFKEEMTKAKLAAVALTIIGVAGVSLGPGDSATTEAIGIAAIGYGLLSGFSYALYYIFGKHYLGRYKTPTLFLYAMPAGALIMVPFFSFGAHPTEAWVAVCTLGLCSTYGAYSVYYAGLKDLEATRAAIVATMEPVVAAVLAYIYWNEQFSTAGYIGSMLILGGVLLTMRDALRVRRDANGQLE